MKAGCGLELMAPLLLIGLFLSIARAQDYVKKDYILPLVYTWQSWANTVLPGDQIGLPLGVKRQYEMFQQIQYKVVCGDKINKGATQIPQSIVQAKLAYAKCSSFLANQKVTLISGDITVSRPLTPVPAYQQLGQYEIRVDDPGIRLSKISSCCSAEACPDTCIEEAQSDCRLELYGPMVYEGSAAANVAIAVGEGVLRGFFGSSVSLDRQYYASLDFIMSIPCQFCSYRSCTTNCSNGQYASNYTDYSYEKDNIQTRKIQCLQCPPGTWNTCRQDTTICEWRIPSNAFDDNVGLNIARVMGGPVGSCYPCRRVKDFLYHYAGTAQQVAINPDLAWRCPGGTSAPENCRTAEFMQSADGASCVCKPGYYALNETFCARCLKGHQCSKGTLEKCPKHYHQPEEGKTECLKCVESATDNGFYPNCLQQGLLLKVCDPNVPGTQDQPLWQQCIPCNQCRRAFVSKTLDDPNRFFCYRDR